MHTQDYKIAHHQAEVTLRGWVGWMGLPRPSQTGMFVMSVHGRIYSVSRKAHPSRPTVGIAQCQVDII